MESSQDYQGIQTACGGGRRRLCQWTYAEDGWTNGYSNADSGAEFLRRCDEQTACQVCQEDLCGIRRYGAILPC